MPFSEQKAPQKNGGILIVEDDSTICHSLAEWLRLDGFLTETASNGQQALEKMQNGFRPCLIILDLMMPVMSGTEFLRRLREQAEYSRVPVVALSGDGRVEEKTKTLGVIATLTKPIDLERLTVYVDRYYG